MDSSRVSIDRLKKDISELVNRVAYGGERFILTSRGKPKAALVSVGDFERLESGLDDRSARWQSWLRAAAHWRRISCRGAAGR